MPSKRAPSSPPDASVSWRDGVHISGTSIWCDAWRARDICFVSAASRLRQVKHAQIIASQETLMLLAKQDGSPLTASQLGVPFGQPFTLGSHRIELFGSGHGLGAASLLVHTDKGRIVYAGSVNPRGSALGGAMDQRHCDVLVVSARYGKKSDRFPGKAQLLDELRVWADEHNHNGSLAVALVATPTKALDLAAELHHTELPVYAQRSLFDLAARLSPGESRLRIPMPPVRRFRPERPGSGLLLWPMSSSRPLLPAQLPPGSEVALVSGRALDPAAVQQEGAQRGFCFSSEADHLELVEYIRASRAKEVYLLDSPDRGEAVSAALPGLRVEAMGPPQQLELF